MITKFDASTSALPWDKVQTKPSLTYSILVQSVFSNPAYIPPSGIQLNVYLTSQIHPGNYSVNDGSES